MRYIAELTKWNGEKETIEIKKEWINDIVFAIRGQFYFRDNTEQITIIGSNYCHVDIYQI